MSKADIPSNPVPPKVVHLTSVHEPFDDRMFHKECRSLAQAGYNVVVIAPHNEDEVVSGITVKSTPPARGRLSRMTLTVWRVYREALRQAADIYHFHDPELIPIGLLLAARGKKVIYDIHEDLPRTIYYKHYIPSWLREPLARLVEGLENVACRFFSALTPATPTIAQRFHFLNNRTVVLHNYPLLREFGNPSGDGWKQRTLSVACTGSSLTVSRGVREMVQAVGLLPEALDMTLRVTGSFLPAALRQEVSCLPGWKRVETLGHLDRAGVSEVLNHARVGLLVDHAEPNNIDALPVKMFEYMASAIPVIASDFPVRREIVQSAACGLTVDPLNVRAIAQAIEHLLTHSAEAEAMGRRGREAVEQKYNWENEEKKLLACYESLLGPAK